ncbi:AAA family ATPase [Photobacterium sp. OFAV2-7]|uniref:AAA family ATPase n=1 Tax=Photobacterium sp. OFAV2-7 TaxID=2917748 RepID=UPI001EF5384A|nr:AAA family ATPase [Photobacterium sp. OFAV2-7]MCG7584365.1 AAA family ATPase [Photobacterium sp. OFAV2-7]
MQPIIITGGPGAGKTTLLNAMEKKGYLVFPEASRALIQQQSQLEGGVLPWTDLPAFAQLCLEMMTEQRNLAGKGTIPAMVDRAVGDICAYLTIGGEPVADHYLEAAKGYYPTVFCCAPNRDIYVQDEERPHSFAEAEQIHRQLVETYLALGYRVEGVPWGSVEERACWVQTRLRQG